MLLPLPQAVFLTFFFPFTVVPSHSGRCVCVCVYELGGEGASYLWVGGEGGPPTSGCVGGRWGPPTGGCVGGSWAAGVLLYLRV